LKLYTYIYDYYITNKFYINIKNKKYALPGNRTTKLKQSDNTKTTT